MTSALVKAGLVQPTGAAEKKLFRADRQAWVFFSAQPAGYRCLVEWRIMSAKKELIDQAKNCG